jgi:hypothetical protein
MVFFATYYTRTEDQIKVDEGTWSTNKCWNNQAAAWITNKTSISGLRTYLLAREAAVLFCESREKEKKKKKKKKKKRIVTKETLSLVKPRTWPLKIKMKSQEHTHSLTPHVHKNTKPEACVCIVPEILQYKREF